MSALAGYRVLAGLLGLGFAATLVWGFMTGGSVVPLLDIMLTRPWGVVTLADLYLGFVLFAGLVLVLEPRRAAGLAWAVAIVLLGNVVTALWVVLRLPAVLAQHRS